MKPFFPQLEIPLSFSKTGQISTKPVAILKPHVEFQSFETIDQGTTQDFDCSSMHYLTQLCENRKMKNERDMKSLD
jgi:hypothetical protein